jgi:hypothetical protein
MDHLGCSRKGGPMGYQAGIPKGIPTVEEGMNSG